MAHSTRTIRLIAASGVAVLMIGGTYAFSGPDPLFGLGRIAEAQSAEELLKEYAAKDSDTDGLPDWQEALYGTDPTNPESFRAGLKDGDAVAQGLVTPKVMVRAEDEPTDPDSIPGTTAAPNSVTDRFAQTLLKQYLLNRGEAPPTQEEVVSFVQAGIADLAAASDTEATFSLDDVVSSGDTGNAALTRYAARAEEALAANNIRPLKNELFYFSDAIKGDTSALARIKKASDAYEATARALILVPVPTEAKRAHLAIVNALMSMASVTADMASLESDPLRALMGIGLYDTVATRSVGAFGGLYGIFQAAQVQIPDGMSGAEFLYVCRTAAAVTTETR